MNTYNLYLRRKLFEKYSRQTNLFECNFVSWFSAIESQLNWIDKKETFYFTRRAAG